MELHFQIPGLQISRTQFKRQNPVKTVDRLTIADDNFEQSIIFNARVPPNQYGIWDILDARGKTVFALCFLVLAHFDGLINDHDEETTEVTIHKSRQTEGLYELMLIASEKASGMRADSISAIVEIVAFDGEAQDWLRSHSI